MDHVYRGIAGWDEASYIVVVLSSCERQEIPLRKSVTESRKSRTQAVAGHQVPGLWIC